jgi:ParB-like chromosome segregation protein Spo0J
MDQTPNIGVGSATMNTETKQLRSLLPADYNPREDLKPGDPEYDALRRGIEENGLVVPLVWNKRTKHLVGGHQRLAVLRDLGWTTVTVVTVTLTDAEERQLNIALNKIDGRWDDQALGPLIDALVDNADIDLEQLGFTDDEYDDLLRRIAADWPGDEPSDPDGDDPVDPDAELDDHASGIDLDPEIAWYTISLSVTTDERRTILSALRRIQARNPSMESSAAALVYLASQVDRYVEAP